MTATQIGAPLPRANLLVTPGRDLAWSVTVKGADGTPMAGALRLTLGALVLTQNLSAGVASFTLTAAQATDALINEPFLVDLQSGGALTAISRGRVVLA